MNITKHQIQPSDPAAERLPQLLNSTLHPTSKGFSLLFFNLPQVPCSCHSFSGRGCQQGSSTCCSSIPKAPQTPPECGPTFRIPSGPAFTCSNIVLRHPVQSLANLSLIRGYSGQPPLLCDCVCVCAFLCFCTLVDAMHVCQRNKHGVKSIAHLACLNHSIVIVVILLLLASSPSTQHGLAARPFKKPALSHSRLVSLTFKPLLQSVQ